MNEILTRRSIRSYDGLFVSNEEIKQIIRAGFSSPSAKNQHIERFLVIDDKQIINKLSTVCIGTMNLQNAKQIIAVYFDKMDATLDYQIQTDLGIVCQSMMIAARCLNIGSTMIGVYPNEEKTKHVNACLNLPKNFTCFTLICIGYPKSLEEFYDKKRFIEEKISYNEVK